MTQTHGFFNGPVVLTFTGDPGALVTYQVDGGSSHTVSLGLGTGQGSITVLGDGTHFVTASDTGNQLIQAVPIDTSGPTISSSISAPHSGNGWSGVGTLLNVSASDTGSGVASLTYQAGGGSAAAVTGPITVPAGTTSYTLTATDFVGNTNSAIVSTKVDTTAPSVTCTGSDGKWHATDQSAVCTGTDTQSAIAGGTSTTGTVTLSTSVPAGSSTANASTAAGQICDNTVNCTPIPPQQGFMVDKAAPAISCPSADIKWHTGTVTFTCTASDSGSGLGTASQSSITLTSLPVAAGTGNGNDMTNTVQVCDKVGNCATAGPITHVMIDNSAPTISITNPTNNAVFTLNQPEVATYSCANVLSGVASCSAVIGPMPTPTPAPPAHPPAPATIPSGATLPTNQVGPHTITVTATSTTGGVTTLTYSYVVTYKICNFVGPSVPKGASALFSVTLCNYSGANVGARARDDHGAQHRRHHGGQAHSQAHVPWDPGPKVYKYTLVSQGLAKGSSRAERLHHRGPGHPCAELHAELTARKEAP